jgi:hypothetical protein
MIEMAIIAMIVSSVTLRVAGNVAVDGFFAARGMESPRLAGARKRRPRGAASRYWSEVWDDTWTGWSAKRAEKRAGQASPSRPRGAATSFWAGWLQDRKRAARKSWDDEWTRLDEKRREKATRPRPGQQTVPGKVVPNAQGEDGGKDRLRDKLYRKLGWSCIVCGSTRGVKDVSFGDKRPYVSLGLKYCPRHMKEAFPEDGGSEDGDGPQDENRPEPTSVPDEDGTAAPDFMCLSCGTRPALPSKLWCAACGPSSEDDQPEPTPTDQQDNPESTPDSDRTSEPTTTKGPTIMTITMPSADVAGFEPTIKWGEASAQGYRAMINEIELCISKLVDAKVTDEALMSDLTSVMEMSSSAANSMDSAMTKLAAHRGVAEAYHATPGAGEKEFMLNG